MVPQVSARVLSQFAHTKWQLPDVQVRSCMFGESCLRVNYTRPSPPTEWPSVSVPSPLAHRVNTADWKPCASVLLGAFSSVFPLSAMWKRSPSGMGRTRLKELPYSYVLVANMYDTRYHGVSCRTRTYSKQVLPIPVHHVLEFTL
eukprot:1141527-Pelagomonas_calceolata.AAC.3